jgi:small-conductance mechanosensitive channel
MNFIFLNKTATAWAAAAAVAVAVTAGLFILKGVLVRRLGVFAARTETKVDDVIVAALDSTKLAALAVIGVYAGAATLGLDPRVHQFLMRAAITAALLQVAIWLDAGVRGWLGHYRERRDEDPAMATSANAISFILRIALWAVIALMILANFGLNITTLVASLGIGGIAVALAVQNILGDLFASLSIVLDKPFVIGDVINVAGSVGTVEHVGLKTTRVRSVSGEQIIYSNTDLLKSRIHNMKRMTGRSRRPPSTARTSTASGRPRSISRRCTPSTMRTTSSTWIRSRRSTCSCMRRLPSAGSRLRSRRRRCMWWMQAASAIRVAGS